MGAGKHRKISRSHARAPHCARVDPLADCPDMWLLLSAAGPAQASTRTAPREGKTLDARKVDRSGARVPLSGEPRPVDWIESCESLSAAEKTAILGSSALRCSDSNA